MGARTTSVIAEEMTQPMAEIEVRSSVQNLRTRAGEFKLAFIWVEMRHARAFVDVLVRTHAINSEDEEGRNEQEAEHDAEGVQFVERSEADYRPRVDTIPFLLRDALVSLTISQMMICGRTKLLMNVGKVHRIGINQRVRDKLPRLPAKNVKASHCVVG